MLAAVAECYLEAMVFHIYCRRGAVRCFVFERVRKCEFLSGLFIGCYFQSSEFVRLVVGFFRPLGATANEKYLPLVCLLDTPGICFASYGQPPKFSRPSQLIPRTTAAVGPRPCSKVVSTHQNKFALNFWTIPDQLQHDRSG